MSSATNLYPAPGAVPTALGQAGPAQPTQGLATGAGKGVSPATIAGGGSAPGEPQEKKGSKLAAFEGLLKTAGHIAGVILADIVKYVIPVASIVAVADPAAAPLVEAFTASVKLVQASVISVQQKWVAEGSQANAQKLSDVLAIVEEPILTMFAQVGVQVDTPHVTNLVNGVVAILNAQPGAVLSKAA